MAMLARIFPSLLTTASRCNAISGKMLQSSLFHSFSNESATQMNPGGLFSISVRTHIRNHFPRPSERKRVKRHGWKTRMSTPEGRRVIMNRMLKGRHVYTH